MASTIKRPGSHFGLDYTSPPSGGASYLKAHGYDFVCRYVSPQSWKRLRRSEISDYHDHGVALILNFESGATNAKGGYSQGRADAASFISVARGLGLTGVLTGYFSVDWDASASEITREVIPYLQGVGSILGKDHVGVYGSYSVVKAAADKGVAKYLWQTYAWSGGKVDPRIHIWQYSNGHNVGGADSDYDQAFYSAAGIGAYGAVSTPTPTPTPVPPVVTTEEDDMTFETLAVGDNINPTNVAYLRNGGTTRYFVASEFGAADIRVVCWVNGAMTAEKVIHVNSPAQPVVLCDADRMTEALSITRVAQARNADGTPAAEGVVTVTVVHNA